MLETLDVGKPIGESLRVDVVGAADTIAWYAEALDTSYDEIAPTGPGALALITRERLGVVAAIAPGIFYNAGPTCNGGTAGSRARSSTTMAGTGAIGGYQE